MQLTLTTTVRMKLCAKENMASFNSERENEQRLAICARKQGMRGALNRQAECFLCSEEFFVGFAKT